MSEIKSYLYVPVDDTIRDKSGLPLHVTVTPPIRHESSRTAELQDVVFEHVTGYDAIELIGVEDEYFGSEEQILRREIHVRKIASPALVALHREVIAAAVANDFAINLEYAGENYSPHVTYIEGQGIERGDRLTADYLRMAQKEPGDVWRDIAGFELSKS